MTESVKLDRTWLCSVVFVDIIEYSRQSLELQTAWKRRFNDHLTEAIKECPPADRVILDTGDGAAICFLGDPETAMFCALRLVGAITEENNQQTNPLQVRAGINLGSVKLVKDINGNLNALGDGVNVGQRVMSFASANKILVSRSFYEVASALSDSYACLFKFEGVHKDKHVREHTLYELHPPEAAQPGTPDTKLKPKALILADDRVAKLEQNLAAIIGPMARHLLKSTIKKSQSEAELREGLLAHIFAKADQEKFLQTCGDGFLPAVPSNSPPPSPAPAPARQTEFIWEPGILERARKDLAVFIGPMARVLVDRAAAKTRSRAALYQTLAGEISSPTDREKFLSQAA